MNKIIYVTVTVGYFALGVASTIEFYLLALGGTGSGDPCRSLGGNKGSQVGQEAFVRNAL